MGDVSLMTSVKQPEDPPFFFLRLLVACANWLRRWVYVGLLVQVTSLFLRDWFWWVDLLSHFVLCALLVTALVWLIEVGRRHWLHVSLLSFAIVMLLLYASSYVHRAHRVQVDGIPLRVMSFNVLTGNASHAAVLEEIKRMDPDVLIIIEVNHAWMKALDQLASQYPHRISYPRSDNFGMACLSKYPLAAADQQQLKGFVAIDAHVAVTEQQRIRVVGVHTPPPMNREYWLRARSMVKGLVARIHPDEPTVVCGDFNATPTSAIWQDLMRGEKLTPTGAGRSLAPTWGPWGFGLLQLDHVFVSGPLVVTGGQLGNFAGSDHRPVLTEVVIP